MICRIIHAGRAVALLAVPAVSFWLAASTATAQPLLKAGDGIEPLAVEQKFKSDKTLKRKRLVEIDTAALEKQILPKDAGQSPDRAERSARLQGEVTLQLFDDVSVTLKVRHVEDGLDGGVVWNGTAGGTNYGILVVNNGKVTGAVEYDGHSFLIEPTGQKNSHRVREVRSEAFPNDLHVQIPKSGRAGSEDTSTARSLPPPPPTGTILQVRLLGAYTARANTMMGGLPAEKISLDVAIVNQGFVNSGVPLHLKLVGKAAVSSTYNERSYADSVQPLYDITSSNGFNFPAIRDKRNSRAADLVTFYVDRLEYCGVAWVNSVPLSASYAFSVINVACVGTISLAHELGHNMSLFHDRYVESAAPASVYNYGYVSTAGRFRDIMSYNNQCSAMSIACAQIPYYSSPGALYKGYPVGIPAGKSGAADAARTLREQARAIAGFR